MASLDSEPKMSLAPTLGPAVRQSGLSLSKVLDHFAKAGFRSAQLDATLPSLRPRELSTEARRDLLALFRRRDMRLSGLDLFIPRKDLVNQASLDRAMGAIFAAVELAGDLGRVPVSLALPVSELAEASLEALVETADSRGVTLAVHAEDQLQPLRDWVTQVDLPCLGMAADPANLIAHNADVEETVHRHARQLAVARLSDFLVTGGGGSADDDKATHLSGMRCVAGQGELNLQGYRLAVELAGSRVGPVVLDLRQMENVAQAASSGMKAWDDAAIEL